MVRRWVVDVVNFHLTVTYLGFPVHMSAFKPRSSIWLLVQLCFPPVNCKTIKFDTLIFEFDLDSVKISQITRSEVKGHLVQTWTHKRTHTHTHCRKLKFSLTNRKSKSTSRRHGNTGRIYLDILTLWTGDILDF